MMQSITKNYLPILIVIFLTSYATKTKASVPANYKKGVEYAVQMEYKKAKSEFEKALKVKRYLDPTNLELRIIEDVFEQRINETTANYYFQGVLEIINSQFTKAIRSFNKAIETNKEFSAAYLKRGRMYSIEGKIGKAIKDFDKAIEIDPHFSESYASRGEAYFDKNEFDKAISDYTKAIENNPGHASTYLNRGLAYSRTGLYKSAINDYGKAIQIRPIYPQAYKARGFTYLVKLGNKARGCADWKKSCEQGMCKNYRRAKILGACK